MLHSRLMNTNPVLRQSELQEPSTQDRSRLNRRVRAVVPHPLGTAALWCWLAGTWAALADPIPVINPGFEDLRGTDRAHFDANGRLLDGDYAWRNTPTAGFATANPAPGWRVTGDAGTYNPSSSMVLGNEGRDVAFLQNPASGPSISQVLCQGLAPGRHTLRADIGRPGDGAPFVGYRLRLLAGRTLLGEDVNSVLPPVGRMATATLVVDVPENHPQLGELVAVELGVGDLPGRGAYVLVDNVRLDGPPSPCRVLANSVSEFSGKQGSNNWYYGYYNLTGDLTPGYNATNDFTLLPRSGYDTYGAVWNINETFWTEVYPDALHPNSDGDNAGGTPQEHWAIRRWLSEVTGLVRIHGWLAKLDTSDPSRSDGVVGMILVNGREVYSRRIEPMDGTGAYYSVVVGLREGDRVDFALSDAGNPYSDSTIFTAIIEPAPQTLSVATAVEASSPTVPGQRYQWLFSPDLESWRPVGSPFTGTGDTQYQLFSIRELGSTGYFKTQQVE